MNCWDFDTAPDTYALIEETRRQSGERPFDLAMVLGSGWGAAGFADRVVAEFSYADWNCFPSGQIAGHDGRMLIVEVQGWQVLVFAGRFHCYQGLSAFAAAFPVRLAKALGVPRLLLTCATGGINPGISPGDFMLVTDHLNLLGDNPLKGLNGDIFVDLSCLYRTDFYASLAAESETLKVRLHRGVLAAMPGPSYETPAEIRMLATSGADVVSMSTVPEAIMGRFAGMEVAALAMITNAAADTGKPPITHQDVLACGQAQTTAATAILRHLIKIWQSSPPL